MRIQAWWQATRESFWFVPALFLAVAIVLAQGMIALDTALPKDFSSPWTSFVYRIGIDGSRSMLSAIGTSMLAVAATAFSITISVVVTASSTYGPRLVGNFMSDRGNQSVLGVFVATFVYALLVLRTIRSADDEAGLSAFVPHLAVNVAIIMAVADAIVLVWFIHHIATSVRVETLAHGVRENLRSVVGRMHPEEPVDDVVTTESLKAGGALVTSGSVGFVSSVDFTALCSAAETHDVVVEILPRVGDHVLPHEPLARVWPESKSDDIEDSVRRHVRTGDSRSAWQDIRYAEQQVLELAVRALSPGTNDPYTAVNAIEEVAAGITMAVSRPIPGNTMLRNGTARVHYGIVEMNEIVDMPFDQIRPFAVDHVMVITSLIDLGVRIRAASIHDAVDDRVRHNIEVLMESLRDSSPSPHDLRQVEEHLAQRQSDLARHTNDAT